MDPRHPESAIWRMDQLAEQFKFVLDKINHASTSSKLGEAEREGALVVQEICLVAPRLHEAMMQASRQRRHDLSRGIMEKPVEKPVVIEKLVETELDKEVNEILKPLEEPEVIGDNSIIIAVDEYTTEEAEVVEKEAKPKAKKKTTKKKKAE